MPGHLHWSLLRPSVAGVAVLLLVPAPAAQLVWTRAPIPPAPPGQFSPILVYDSGRSRTVLFGGAMCGGDTDAGVWEFDGTGWTQFAPPLNQRPVARWHHGMAYDAARARSVVFGGKQESSLLADTWLWDGTAWAQLPTAVAPAPRWKHKMAYHPILQRTVLFGGDGSNPPGHLALGDTWEWNGSAWQQRTPVHAPAARWDHSLTYDDVSQKVLLFGGTDGAALFQDTWLWDGSDWTQATNLPSSPPGRSGQGAAASPANGGVLLFGGQDPTGPLGDTWQWDGSGWSQPSATGSPPPRSSPGIAMHRASSGAQVVMVGGQGATQGFQDAWRFNGNSWTLLGQDPPFVPHAMAWDSGRQRLVLFGGMQCPALNSTQFNPQSDLWEWDGSAWSRPLVAVRPEPRAFHGLAYDRDRQRLVVFGGLNADGTRRDDLWEWDGTQWLNPQPVVRPPARVAPAMAYDEARHRVLLFSGDVRPSQPLADTWEWDGTSWVLRQPAHAPPAREQPGCTYDRARARVVLFGGFDTSGTRFNDTWEWDGFDWAQRSPANPPVPRGAPKLAYDSLRCRTVMFGGSIAQSILVADTWEWDGAEWISRTHGTQPGGRYHHALGFDEVRGKVVLFGGVGDSTGHLLDTWELASQAPATFTAFGSGCSGAWPQAPVLSHRGLPYIGCRFEVTLHQAAPSPAAILMLGTDLDVPLDGIGAPGCRLYVNPFVFLPTPVSSGDASVPVVVPNDPTLVGGGIAFQYLVIAPLANMASILTTNRGTATIGM